MMMTMMIWAHSWLCAAWRAKRAVAWCAERDHNLLCGRVADGLLSLPKPSQAAVDGCGALAAAATTSG